MVDPRRFSTALGRYWRTARHLRPLQVSNRLVRCLPRSIASPAREPSQRRAEQPWPVPGESPSVFTSADHGRLLHREAPLDDWNPAALPRLWRYHLHYFDDRRSPHFARLAERWIAEHLAGAQPGWEPYPLSRRIPNWVIWMLDGHAPVPGMLASLDRQAASLAAQLEYHLLGNHLLANLRALVFAGAFFANRPQWLARGVEEFSRQLDDQLLPGGAHAERSPMYHALILHDLLDLIALAHVYPGVIPSGHELHWRLRAAQMLHWLTWMCHPDGAIAFFQDAAFDMAPAPSAIQEYARRLGVAPVAAGADGSGYARIEQGGTMLIFDAAGPAPAHQPGHAHAGALSFELSHQGQRILVNSGTSTYEPGVERCYERSTAAHNTLVLNGRDQSEMWAAFRVGRRATVEELERTDLSITARHDGYAPVVHQRRLCLDGSRLLVEDRLDGSGTHQGEIFFHFHPEVALTQRKPRPSGLAGHHASGLRFDIRPPAQLQATVEASQWRPEFGLRLPNQRLRLSGNVALPVTFHTHIEFGS